MLKKKLAGIVLVGAIVCSVPVAAFAENVQGDTTVSSATKFHPMKQLLEEKAQAFGIATDGKTGKEIRAALHAAKEAKKAAKQAKVAAAVNKRAAKLGISTDGKTTEQVFAEIESALQAKWAKQAAK